MEATHEKKIADMDGYCLKCGKVTPNAAVYVGDLLKQRKCLVCGEVMACEPGAMAKEYLKELAHRALDKPDELAREYRTDPTGFVMSIPFRAVSKSIRELDYLCKLFLPES